VIVLRLWAPRGKFASNGQLLNAVLFICCPLQPLGRPSRREVIMLFHRRR
jgi:hypothetical protein